MEKTLDKTKNAFVCVGTVSEIDLEQVNAKAKINHGTQEVSCQAIKGKIVVEVDGKMFVTFPVYFTSVGFDGQESRQWTMAQHMLEYNPKINGNVSSLATRVRVRGEFNPYDRYSDYTHKVEYNLGYRVASCSSSNVPEEDCFNINIENAFIAKTAPEMNGDEETGRALIDLICVNYSGEIYPVQCVVESEGVDVVMNGDVDFDAFVAGQTRTNLKFELVNANSAEEAPKAQSTGRSFGRKRKGVDPSARTQYRNEIILCECDSLVCEKPEEETVEDESGNIVEVKTLWLNPATVKEAVQVRKQKLEEMAQTGAKKANASSSSNDFAARKAQAKKQVAAKKSTKVDSPTSNDDSDIYDFEVDF